MWATVTSTVWWWWTPTTPRSCAGSSCSVRGWPGKVSLNFSLRRCLLSIFVLEFLWKSALIPNSVITARVNAAPKPLFTIATLHFLRAVEGPTPQASVNILPWRWLGRPASLLTLQQVYFVRDCYLLSSFLLLPLILPTLCLASFLLRLIHLQPWHHTLGHCSEMLSIL